MRYVWPATPVCLNIAACLLTCELKSVQEEMESLLVPTTKNSPVASQLIDLRHKRGSLSRPEECLINPSEKDDEVSNRTVLKDRKPRCQFM